MFLLYVLAFLLHETAATLLRPSGKGFAIQETVGNYFVSWGGNDRLALYYATLALLYGIYLGWIARAPRPPRPASWAGAALLLMLALVPPSRSTDMLAYLAHGHNGAGRPAEAHTRPIYPADPDGYLQDFRERHGLVGHGPTPYGPLWTHYEVAVAKASGERAWLGIALLKLGNLVAYVGSAAIVAALAGPVAAAVFFFNPLLLTELVVEGHNDAWLLLFSLLAIFALLRSGYGAAVLAGAAAVLTKYIPALLLGPFLVYLRARPGGWVRPFLLGAGVAAAAATLLYFPFWQGPATFVGMRENAEGVPSFARILARDYLKAHPVAGQTFRLFLTLGFFAFWAWSSSRARDLPGFILAAAGVFYAYFVFFPPFLWPWYFAVPISFLLLLPESPWRRPALLLSAIASIGAPAWPLFRAGFLSAPTGNLWQHGIYPALYILSFGYFLRRMGSASPRLTK